MEEEKLLLQRLREGDQRAFEELYHRYARGLFLRAYSKTGVKEICEDLVQDIFSGLWMKRGQLEIRQSLGAYLQGVLDNKIVDHYRRTCMHLRHLDELIALFDRAELNPADQLTYKEQESFLQAYISGLSGRMREVFLLSREAGLPHAEISRRLNLSSQTVRNQISKALKTLREKMVPHDVPASGASEK
jgi:RNA polymerase sigma-70 factor (ECF subfamily)